MARLRKAPGPPAEQPERDRNLDPWRRPSSEAAQALVAEALALFAAREAELGLRQRKRRAQDQAVMEETVAALVCDALHRELARRGGRVMVPLSNQVLGKRGRYRAPLLSKALPDILRVLSGPVLTMEKGRKGYFDDARRTTVALSPAFIERARALGLGFADLRREPGGEVIILKASKGEDEGDGAWVDYLETSETERFRADLVRINDFLAAADIEVHPFGTAAERADPRDRHLRRIFNNRRFDLGGRLFGGFWQRLPKAARREAIAIDEDGITELDFRQMAPRLLYARAGVLPPDDCYAVPGFEQYRDGWKRLLNAMLFSGRDLGRLPRGTRDLLPPHLAVGEAVRRVLGHNAGIAHLVEKDVGFSLMFDESEILVDVLLRLASAGITALPIHDAILVRSSARDEAKGAMVEAFRGRTGYPGEVGEG